jgi:hypothetical protein
VKLPLRRVEVLLSVPSYFIGPISTMDALFSHILLINGIS